MMEKVGFSFLGRVRLRRPGTPNLLRLGLSARRGGGDLVLAAAAEPLGRSGRETSLARTSCLTSRLSADLDPIESELCNFIYECRLKMLDMPNS